MEKRWLLFLILTLVVLQIFSRMMRQQHPVEPSPPTEAQATPVAQVTPSIKPQETEIAVQPLAPEEEAPVEEISLLRQEIMRAEEIIVRTEIYDIRFTTYGAKPISWKITDQRFTHNSDAAATAAVEIIPQKDGLAEGHEFPLEIGLQEYKGKDFGDFNRVNFSVARSETAEGNIKLQFESPEIDGIQIVKTYQFQPANYLVSFSVNVRNVSKVKYRFNENGTGLRVGWGAGIGLLREEDKAQRGYRGYIRSVYLTNTGVKSQKPKIDRSEEFLGKIDWGGLEDKFFLAAIIPLNEEAIAARSGVKARNLTSRYKEDKSLIPPLTFEVFSEEFALDPDQDTEFSYKLFVGPKELDTLNESGYRLSKVLFHTSWSWMRALCIVLLRVLKTFYSIVKNYGIAILLLTLFIRVITHPLTHKGMKLQAKAMAEQQKLKPYIEEINKKHKGNAQMRNKEIMKLYKEHGINPLGQLRGCFPLLLQMPIFFALYRLLMQSIELRGEPFLWIKDLSGPDALVTLDFNMPLLGPHINLLPILMGLSQVLVSKFSTASIKDSTQRQMMIMMPIFLTVILYNLPAGLVLYWLLSNIWQTGHQVIANKIIQADKKEGAATPKKK